MIDIQDYALYKRRVYDHDQEEYREVTYALYNR